MNGIKAVISGQTRRISYPRTDWRSIVPAGQVTRYTDPLGYATSFAYDGSGHLKNLKGPISGAEYSYTYDGGSRVASTTDPAGSTVHYTYDADDRPLTATYPDSTVSRTAYTLLDLTSSTDRLGQKTLYTYDADRELTSTADPLHHTVKQGYNLAGKLDSLTDANNHTTTFTLDAQSRVIAKQYANGTSQSITYASSISLIGVITDALNQTTSFAHNLGNTTSAMSYSANQLTPSVSFTYDPAYRRATSMTDGSPFFNQVEQSAAKSLNDQAALKLYISWTNLLRTLLGNTVPNLSCPPK